MKSLGPLRTIGALGLIAAAASLARGQTFDLPAAADRDPQALARSMRTLAAKLLAVYRNADRAEYLDNRFRLECVAGREADARRTLAALQGTPLRGSSARALVNDLQYRILLRARQRAAANRSAFDAAFRSEFRDEVGALDDRRSALVIQAFRVEESSLRRDLEAALAARKGKGTISLAEAMSLLRAYQIDEAYRAFAPLVGPLADEEDRRRYVTERDIPIRTSDGATVCALVMRPRAVSGRLPALLQFTIYADPGAVEREARRTASNGYASVIGFTRGKACSPEQPVPYEHDGEDAAAVVDWITRQEWSDGRVGMYGGSYSGFTPWAAARRMPKGLKAIMVGAPAAPGIDVPMEGNVFWNFVYPWPFYTTDNKSLDDATYGDSARWRRLDHDWYASGRAYRDLEKIDGVPNPIFDRWIGHPAYDAYWSRMTPDAEAFARIDIPVLTTAGYYYGGPGAAVHYFEQHYRSNPTADHYLLIGPYDHFQAQRGTGNILGPDDDLISGYRRDPAALIDMFSLRYQWFDHVFKGGPMPVLLQDRVNYEVTGADVWKHTPSIAAMSGGRRRFHLTPAKSGQAYRLSDTPSPDATIPLTVDLADRRDVDRPAAGGGVLDTAVDTHDGLEFESDAFPGAIELSGLFSGHLEFVANKKDFDFEIDLYERTAAGAFVQLAPYWSRASHVGDPVHRRLLSPGVRERLDFQSGRLMSRRLARGSRLVAVLRIVKEPGRQIDYGTGKDVSEETIADAGEPLLIQWFGASFLEVPEAR